MALMLDLVQLRGEKKTQNRECGSQAMDLPKSNRVFPAKASRTTTTATVFTTGKKSRTSDHEIGF